MVRHSGFILSLALALTACDPGYGPDDEEFIEEADSDDGADEGEDDATDDEPQADDGADDSGQDDGDEPGNDDGSDDGDEPSDDGGEPSDDGGEPATVFESTIVPILQARCGCHGGGSPSAGLDLDADAAFDMLVGAPSSVGMPYVTPGDPDASYLIHKIEGTQSEVGGGGSSMPPGGTIPADELDAIVAWIADGATQ